MPDESTYELPEDLTFEQAVERLEEIVETLESDGFALEEALEAHAEGIALARFCMNRLEKAELRIQQLSLPND
ncbi:MAG: exodeoxyribonuclease VII small subunit [Rhodothermales bacterium]